MLVLYATMLVSFSPGPDAVVMSVYSPMLNAEAMWVGSGSGRVVCECVIF